MLTKVIVDRIEGDIAVLELDPITFIEMPLRILPVNCKLGDVLHFDIHINEQETENRLLKNKQRLNTILQKSSK